jgi:hypothetical protein
METLVVQLVNKFPTFYGTRNFITWPTMVPCKLKISLWFIEALYNEAVWGSGGTALRIVNLRTSWSWMVSFTLPPLYNLVKSSSYPLVRRLGGSQSWSGSYLEEKGVLTLTRIEFRFIGHPAHDLVTMPTKLSWPEIFIPYPNTFFLYFYAEIGFTGKFLWMWWRTFSSHKLLGASWVAEKSLIAPWS